MMILPSPRPVRPANSHACSSHQQADIDDDDDGK